MIYLITCLCHISIHLLDYYFYTSGLNRTDFANFVSDLLLGEFHRTVENDVTKNAVVGDSFSLKKFRQYLFIEYLLCCRLFMIKENLNLKLEND